ncbi:hypothetical protein LSH36_26g02139, partial [Paralvinella palmiformis]
MAPRKHVEKQFCLPGRKRPDPTNCKEFYSCVTGKSEYKFKCPHGMAFDRTRSLCVEEHQVATCTERTKKKTVKPKDGKTQLLDEDVDNNIRCPDGLVFNEMRNACDLPSNVPICMSRLVLDKMRKGLEEKQKEISRLVSSGQR